MNATLYCVLKKKQQQGNLMKFEKIHAFISSLFGDADLLTK